MRSRLPARIRDLRIPRVVRPSTHHRSRPRPGFLIAPPVLPHRSRAGLPRVAVEFLDQVIPPEEVECVSQLREPPALLEPVENSSRFVALVEPRLVREWDFQIGREILPPGHETADDP